MKDLIFDTGVVTYNLNGKCEVSFNPTDSGFAEKLYNAFSTLDGKKAEYEEQIKKAGDNAAIFDLFRKMDEEMRDIINEVFGFDVCTPLFGDLNIYAFADGLPVWANLLLGLMDELDSSVAKEQKAMNPRISKYTKKYHK